MGLAVIICHFFRKFCQDEDEDEEYRNKNRDMELGEPTVHEVADDEPVGTTV